MDHRDKPGDDGGEGDNLSAAVIARLVRAIHGSALVVQHLHRTPHPAVRADLSPEGRGDLGAHRQLGLTTRLVAHHPPVTLGLDPRGVHSTYQRQCRALGSSPRVTRGGWGTPMAKKARSFLRALPSFGRGGCLVSPNGPERRAAGAPRCW